MSELALGQIKGLSVNANKVTVPSGHTLYAPGHVVQTVTATSSTLVASTANGWVSTGLTASLTPKFNTSKILVLVSLPAVNVVNNIASIWTIFRGDVSTGTNLGTTNTGSAGLNQLYSAGGEIRLSQAMTIVDSPATTSAVTYTAAFNPVGGNASAMQEGRRGTITLLEIAA